MDECKRRMDQTVRLLRCLYEVFGRKEGKQDKRNENDAMECIKKTNYVFVNRRARGNKDCQGAKNEMKSIHQFRAIDIDTG